MMLNKKAPFIIVMLVLCVVFVSAAVVFTQISPLTSTTENSSVNLEWNFTIENLSPPNEVKFNWDGTNTTVFDESVVLYMNFDNRSALGESNTHVFDLSGNGNNATVNGGVNATFVPGVYGNALKTIRTTGYAQILDSDSLDFNTTTISFWFKTNTQSQDIIRKLRSGVGGSWGIWMNSDGRIYVDITSNGTTSGDSLSRTFTTNEDYNDNEWHLLTFTYNLSIPIIYIDGEVEKVGDSFIKGIDFSTENIRIASQWAQVNNFNGTFDDLIIFNRSLSSSEVSSLHLSSLTKYNSTEWSFLTAQSMETNTTGISYDYFLCSTNSTNSENCTSENIITRIPESVSILSNFTSETKTLQTSGLYGSTTGSVQEFFGNSTYFNIDTNDDGSFNALANRTWHKETWSNANMNIIRMGLPMDYLYFNTTDPSGVNFSGDLSNQIETVKWAYENNISVILATNNIPDWLANISSNCISNNLTCPPNNYTKYSNILNDTIYRVTSGFQYISAIDGLELKNEPYLPSFWLSDLSIDNITRATEYIIYFNETYNAMKVVQPTLKIGTGAIIEEYPNMYNGILGNITQNDFITYHAYKESYLDGSMTSLLNNVIANCTSANCTNIILSEWNVNNVTVKNNTDETQYYAEIASGYIDGLNYNGSLAFIGYQWEEEYSYWTNSANYPSYPQKWAWVSEKGLDDKTKATYYAPYNVTKNFATYHSAGSTVYESVSSQSAVKAVSSKKGNASYITVINTDTEARNITVDTGSNLTTLFNQETGEEFISDADGVFNVGVMDSYEILYLGNDGNMSIEVVQLLDGTTINNETITLSIWLRAINGIKNAGLYIYNATGTLIESVFEVIVGSPTEYLWNVTTDLTDGTYTWFVNVTDDIDEVFTSPTYEFTVDTSFPVTLNSPDNNTIVSSPVTFNCSASIPSNFTSGNVISNISLWNNFSGTWELNDTLDAVDGLYNTLNYTGESFTASEPSAGPYGITQNGTYFWITGFSNEVYKYYINGTYTGEEFSAATNSVGITNDGTYLWITDPNADEVYKYYMNGTNTGYSFDTNVAGNFNAAGITQNGTYFWITDESQDEVYKYYINGTYTGDSFDTAGIDPAGITQNGEFLWITGRVSGEIHKYYMNGTDTGYSFNISDNGNDNPWGTTNDGTYLWVNDPTTDTVYKYQILFNTATFTKTISTNETINGIWNCQACNSENVCSFASDNFVLTVDDEGPNITVEAPVGTLNYSYVGNTETLNVTFTDVNLSECWYNYNGTNISIDGCVSGVKNSTQFILEDKLNMTIYANDTFGNINSDFINITYEVFEVDRTFATTAVEGTTEDFQIEIKTAQQITSANLIYDDITYVGTLNQTELNHYIIDAEITIPTTGINRNITFFWQVIVPNPGIINTTSSNQSVSGLQIDNCTDGDLLIMNYSLLEEQSQDILNGTIEVDIEFLSPDGTTVIANFSDDYVNQTNAEICLSNVTADEINYLINVVTGYTAPDFAEEFHNIQMGILDNTTIPINISLYDLSIDRSTTFTVSYKSVEFLPITGSLFDIQRKYISEGVFKSVEIIESDAQGFSKGHFDTEGVIYRITISKDGEVIDSFDNIKVLCDNAITEECNINLNSFQSGTDFETWNQFGDVTFELAFSSDLRTSAVSFNTVTGTPKNMTLVSKSADGFSTQLCSSSLFSSAGVIQCEVPISFGNGTVITTLSTNEINILTQQNVISSNPVDSFGVDAYVFAFILVISFPLMMISSPIGVIFGLVFGVLASFMLLLADSGGLLGPTAALTWLIVAALILVYKMMRRDRL